MTDRCYHLVCDITRTFGNESNFIQCRECKKEFRENTQDFGVAIGAFPVESVMYYGDFQGSAINNIWRENKQLKKAIDKIRKTNPIFTEDIQTILDEIGTSNEQQ